MTPERWQQVQALCRQVEELPDADRRIVLEQVDPELRREVESLLAQEGSLRDGPIGTSLIVV